MTLRLVFRSFLVLAALTPSLAFGNASVLQEQDTPFNNAVTTVTSPAFSSNATIGSTIEVWVAYQTTTGPTSCVDSASQTYTAEGSENETYNNSTTALWIFQNNQSATKLTVTCTWAASGSARAVWVREIGGVSATSFQSVQFAYIATPPGTGTDAIQGASITPTSQPALMSALARATNDPTAEGLTAGTGFTAGVQGWLASVDSAYSESIRLTSTAATKATFTDATAGSADQYVVGEAIYSEGGGSVTPKVVISNGKVLLSNGKPIL